VTMSEQVKSNYILPIILSLILASGLLGGILLKDVDKKSSRDIQKLEDVLNLLDKNYVDKVDKDAIFEATISDMLHKLDPHSNYISAKDMKSVNESIEGKFGGVGIRFLLLRDTICVTNIIDQSPSQHAGMKAGDKIVSVNGKKICGKGITNEKVLATLKGQAGTSLSVTFVRGKRKITANLVRGIIPISSIPCAYMLDKQTGYILISEFSQVTSEEFYLESSKLLQQGMTKMVLDLRNNPGGVMASAIDIADAFLAKNNMILKSKGKNEGERTYYSTSGGHLEKTKVVVLINAHSASASEILAGAIQDNDRGIIVGRRSYGKGLIQKDEVLRDGSNLRLTIARYYTPSGRCIQRSYNGGYDNYMRDEERITRNEYFKPDSSIFVDSLKFKTKHGRTVYGGGGIMPDVFVPGDTSGSSFYLTELQWSGAARAFAFDFMQTNRAKWSTAKDFVKEFEVSEELLTRFVAFAQKDFHVQKDPLGLAVSKELIKHMLKAEIASQNWTEEGYYRVLNPFDKELIKAISSFK
jgi:carboxyl-terminal processing protease